MDLRPGAKLGSCEIISLLGKGGMGEVWKAHDPQIGRDVAIKVSDRQFTDRFEREVRAIGALNHPNICTLYHVGPNYLVMELVEGPTLAERIKEGPIPVEEALGYAEQIADALEAAHQKSIVHRDLKPANIKIRPDGSVKVLDFGLAKAGETREVTPDSPTMMPGTQIGMILGTAGYMSSEQARGKEVDKRADIWAFGVVLYEMLTGKRLFEGETVSDTLAAVLTREPDLKLAPERTRPLLAAMSGEGPKAQTAGYRRCDAAVGGGGRCHRSFTGAVRQDGMGCGRRDDRRFRRPAAGVSVLASQASGQPRGSIRGRRARSKRSDESHQAGGRGH
jgi:eukaryotic-like serine/threonine-protein kinase